EFLMGLKPILGVGKPTEEDRARAKFYQDNEQRKALIARTSSKEDYLRSLGIQISIKENEVADIPRIVQLTQRTNQFNLTNHRYTEEQIRSFMNNPDYRIFTLRMKDKIGYGGIVGLIILEKLEQDTSSAADAFLIDTFCISCRAIGLGIEQAFMSYITRVLHRAYSVLIWGYFRPSQNNALVKDLYSQLGFEKRNFSTDEQNGEYQYLFCMKEDKSIIMPDWVTVVDSLNANTDTTRPLPDRPVPSKEEVDVLINRVGWDSDNVAALVVEAKEVTIAKQYLLAIGREDMAKYLEYLAKAGLIRAGPFEGFLAATYTDIQGQEGIALTTLHSLHGSLFERVASLIHEVGATSKFSNSHETNTKRENSFIELINIAGDQSESLLGALLSKQAKDVIKYDKRFKADDQSIVLIKLAQQLKVWQEEYRAKLGKEITLTGLLKEEFFELINEDGKLLGRVKPRKLVHYDGDWHRDVRTLVVNENGEMLLQWRSSQKDIEPSCYGEGVGGHLSLGDNYLAAVIREFEEEVGLACLHRERLFRIGAFKDEVFGSNHAINRSHFEMYVYLLLGDEQQALIPDKNDGIDECRFLPVVEWQKMANSDPQKFARSVRMAFNNPEIFRWIDSEAFRRYCLSQELSKKVFSGELTDAEVDSLDTKALADIIRLLPLQEFVLEAKKLVYSAAPGSGKGAIMEIAFVGNGAPYSDLFQKLILHHTRNARAGEVDGKAYHFGFHDVGESNKNRLLVLGEKGQIYIAYINKQCQGLAKDDFIEEVVLHKKDAPIEVVLPGDEVIEESTEYVKVRRPIKGLAAAFKDKKLTFLEGGYSWFKAISEDKAGIYTIFLSPFTPEQVILRGNNQGIIASIYGSPFERFLGYSILNMMRKEKGAEELDLREKSLLEELKVRVAGWLGKYSLADNISPELEKEAVLALGRNDADKISALRANSSLIESGLFIEELNHLLADYFKHPTFRVTAENTTLARAIAYEVQMKLARDVKRGDTSFELKVPAREKEKAAKFDKSEDMFNRVLEGVAQIMLMKEYERAGRGAIVVNSFIWSGSEQEIQARMSKVAEEFCGKYFRYLIKSINGYGYGAVVKCLGSSLTHTNSYEEDGQRVSSVITYGKDYATISKYFGSDHQKAQQALLKWQEEFKALLGLEKTLVQLTTFKDDQHKEGTEYFLVTDEQGNYLKGENGNYMIRPRDLCHKDGTWHRSVFMILVDETGKILVQVRSDDKKFFPGCRDCSASGHAGLAVEYIEAAANETEEEVFDSTIKLDRSRIIPIGDLGLLENFTVVHNYPDKGLKDYERSGLFLYFVTNAEKSSVKKQESEVKELSWVTLEEELSRWKLWKENPQRAKVQGIDYAALGIDIFANPLLLSKVQRIISEHLSVLDGNAIKSLHNFAPNSKTKAMFYSDLAESFSADFEGILGNLSLPEGRQYAGGKSTRAESLVALLNNANVALKDLISRFNTPELTAYYSSLRARPSNRGPPMVIRVSSRLRTEAARHYNQETNSNEIIFEESFINNLLRAKPRDAAIILAIRIFHELGHSLTDSYNNFLKQEYDLIKKDAQFCRALALFRTDITTLYPSHYFNLLNSINNHPEVIKDFDMVISELERMEIFAKRIYRNRSNFTMNEITLLARSDNIQRAFEVADADFDGSIVSSLKRIGFLQGTFLYNYLTILGCRGIAAGREAFFFLEEGKQVILIPFGQLKNPRLVGKDKKDGKPKEYLRWARQYYPLHYGLYMSEGIAPTEAENGRGFQQKWHEHPFVEQTISLCDYTQVRFAKYEVKEGLKIRREGDKEYVDEGEDSGKEIGSVELPTGDSIKKFRFVVDERIVPFGNMIMMPPHTYHTLNNLSRERPSIDFTTKEPVTQLIKNFIPDTQVKLSVPVIKPAKEDCFPWGKILTQHYGNYNSKMLINAETREMAYAFNKDGEPEMVMFDKFNLDLKLAVVRPGAETARIKINYLYDKMQPIRVFPWPALIPADEIITDSADPADHKWALDRDVNKLRARVRIYNKSGVLIKELESVRGGDIILIDNAYGEEEADSFTVENRSLDNFELMFFYLELKLRQEDVYSDNTTLDMTDVLMGFPGSVRENNDKPYSDVAVILDKDGTLVECNESITDEIKDKLVNLLENRVNVVVLTGGILGHSLESFIIPLEQEIMLRGKMSLFPYLRYYFMSGNGMVSWNISGDRKIEYCTERYSEKEKHDIMLS
ncbi:MAG: NUDIX domain-containing protein, partial [Candidatus Omnitrophica bacterium]|nr:NUDIX domain-containing protein [Candidatus Omnitrophota bacterium]